MWENMSWRTASFQMARRRVPITCISKKRRTPTPEMRCASHIQLRK